MENRAILSRASRDNHDAHIIQEFLSALDCPRALTVWIMYQHDPVQLTSLACQPRDYHDFTSFDRAYKATSFLSKYDGLETGIDRRRVALDSFFESERRCADTNLRLTSRLTRDDTLAWHLLQVAKRKISQLLPPLGSVLEEVISLASFGPGVTLSLSGDWLGGSSKITSKQTVTPLLHSVLDAVLGEGDYPSWTTLRMRCVVPWNKVTVVPKNSKTDRTIAIEPSVNAFYQKGVGRWLQRRLRRWGLALDDQSKNADLAREGSSFNRLATIDLSAASDSVSLELVRFLLPDDWCRFLEVLRSTHYLLDGKVGRYEKFSSMGCGFTFELETMIFMAFCLAVKESYGDVDDICRVYGDDIICPSYYEHHITALLHFSGFSLNTKKSYFSGNFRESCGKHWWAGRDCTPFYFKKSRDYVQRITLANWIFERGLSQRLWKLIYFSVPKAWANKGPPGGPGTYFHDYDHLYDSHFRWGRRCISFVSVIFEPRKRPRDGYAALGSALLSLGAIEGLSIEPDETIDRTIEHARRRGKWVRRRVYYLPRV